MFKFFKWLFTDANAEGWKILYYGACLGAAVAFLFCFPFRYRVLVVDNPHMAPVWLKFDRLTGASWKSFGDDGEWTLMTNHIEAAARK